jgi:hypothetical protein
MAAASLVLDNQPCEPAVCQQFVEPVVAMADGFKGRAGQATRGACVSAAERGLQVIATDRTAATRARRS